MTPKDVVRLCTGMIFANDDELMSSDTGIVRTLYDQTCGTAGFICDALDLLNEWHENKQMKAPAVIVPSKLLRKDADLSKQHLNELIKSGVFISMVCQELLDE